MVLVEGLRRSSAGKVTAGLAESNGSLRRAGGDLKVTCGLTACTLGSASDTTIGNEYRRTLPVLWQVFSIDWLIAWQVFSIAEMYEPAKRNVVYNITSLVEFFWNFPSQLLSPQVIINSTKQHCLFYNVTLRGLEIPLQAFHVHLDCLHCSSNVTGISRQRCFCFCACRIVEVHV